MKRRLAPLVLSAIGLCPILVVAPASAQPIKVTDLAGTPGGRMLVILGDGYQASELGTFKAKVDVLVQELLKEQPFDKNGKALFIRRIDVASEQSGADDPRGCGGSGATPDTFFDARFCADGTNRRLLRVDEAKVYQVLNTNTPGWHSSLVIVNSTFYGGSGGDPAVVSLGGLYPRTAIHELGHSLFHLADEYPSRSGCPAGSADGPSAEPEEPNVTTVTDPNQIKWKSRITKKTLIPTTKNANCAICDPQAEPQPIGSVGLYEGAMYRHCGAYRPAFHCTMRSLDRPFCPVCAKQIVHDLRPFAP